MFRREKISTSVFSFFLLFISSFTDKEETIKKKRKSDVMSAGRMFNHYDARMVVFLPGIMIKHTWGGWPFFYSSFSISLSGACFPYLCLAPDKDMNEKERVKKGPLCLSSSSSLSLCRADVLFNARQIRKTEIEEERLCHVFSLFSLS